MRNPIEHLPHGIVRRAPRARWSRLLVLGLLLVFAMPLGPGTLLPQGRGPVSLPVSTVAMTDPVASEPAVHMVPTGKSLRQSQPPATEGSSRAVLPTTIDPSASPVGALGPGASSPKAAPPAMSRSQPTTTNAQGLSSVPSAPEGRNSSTPTTPSSNTSTTPSPPASPHTSQVPAPDWAEDAVVPVGAPIGASIADDVFDGYVVLFGGYGFASLPQSLTWVYSGHGWENLTASQIHRPPPCKYCAMTYDAEYQYVILFDQGTWVFQSGQWSQAGPANSPPPTLVEASMAYDAGDHEVVLFGGNYQDPGCNCHVTTGATWAYRASNWVNISATVGTAPSARRWATMVYDTQDSEDVLLGGWNDQAISLLNDTWTFSGGRWSLSSASGPLPRALGQLTFDATDGYVLLYGGTGCNAVNWLCSDTWTFRAGVWTQLFPLVSPIVENGSQEVMSYDTATGYTVLLEQATTSGNFTTNESIPFTWPAPLTVV